MFSTNKQKQGGKLLPHQKACCLSGSWFVFFKREAKERRQIELSFFALAKLFSSWLLWGWHRSHPFTTRPTDEFSAGFCLLACSGMQIRQFLSQLKAVSPVSAVVVCVLLFLREGSGHWALLPYWGDHNTHSCNRKRVWGWRLELAWRRQKRLFPLQKEDFKGRITEETCTHCGFNRKYFSSVH